MLLVIQATAQEIIQSPRTEPEKPSDLIRLSMPKAGHVDSDFYVRWRYDANRLEIRIRKSVDELEGIQKRDVKRLRDKQAEFEPTWSVPEVARLKALMEDPEFKVALTTFLAARTQVREKVVPDGQPLFGPSPMVIDRFEKEYRPLFDGFALAIMKHEGKVASAVIEARNAAPGLPVDVIARSIQIKLLRTCWDLVDENIKMLFVK